MTRTRPMIDRGGSIDGIVFDSISAIEELRDEMQDWMDNMSSNNMEHLPKYEEVNEAYDLLDDIVNTSLDMPELLPDMVDEVKWQEKAPYKGAQSRSVRAGSASSDIEQVIGYIESFLSDTEETDDNQDLRQEWETYKDELQEVVDKINEVSFPGMYG